MKIIYPGTFDPFSLGHLDLVERAAKMFQHVIIGVSENQRKTPRYSFADRIAMAKLAVAGIEGAEVKGFSNLLVDFMKENDSCYVLRGIRGIVDFEYEFQMAQANRSMLAGFEPVFLMPGEKYMVLSSSIIREMAFHGGDLSAFLPPAVNEYINKLG
ncbi:MAG: pantetheine-phosphate adenylyltransferase [Deferribacteraceae bacterium]|jgi:pantetheine-phosphate adenylyltransferase|nr:pantetheine-phosphate adenylyltransferase [Deferribacteraceae bacterium]